MIARRAVVLDARKLGFSVDVFAHIRVGVHYEAHLEAFEAAVGFDPEFVKCLSMSGESNYPMRVVARRIELYECLLKMILMHLLGVTPVNLGFVFKPVKVKTDVPV